MTERDEPNLPIENLNPAELYLYKKIMRYAARTGKYGHRAAEIALQTVKKNRQRKGKS